MFDTLGYYPILFIILSITIFLNLTGFFVTKTTTKFYDKIGFIKSFKYRIIIFLIVLIGNTFINYQCKKYVMKKKGKEGNAFTPMINNPKGLIDTIIP